MKTSLLVILSVALFFGCKSGTNNYADSAGTDMGITDNNSANNVWDQEKIREFVDKAATGSLMEVELGKMAQKKAMSQQVKDFGKLMEKDHSDAGNKLKTAVQALNLNVPTTLDQEHQDKVNNLNEKTGNDFDKAYMDEMVDDHKEDINDFEDAQRNLPSGDLKTWVDDTLPVLRQHLAQAETIRDQLNNNN